MTPEHLAELQAAWPGEWQSESHAPKMRWLRLRDVTFVAYACTQFGEEYRSLGSSQTNWHATGSTFAECMPKLKRQLHADARAMRRRAEDIERLAEDMP